jgi:hypothetical protein
VSRDRRPSEELTNPLMADWRMCEMAGFISFADSPAVEPLRRLRFRHEARVPPALDCYREALAVLEELGEVEAFEAFSAGRDRAAGRWPTRERVEMERRVRVLRPDSAARADAAE